jgi:ectoine hydroxylase-related dioxygenase (phytanoyl-CoA dioxygenase family)
MDSSQLDGRNMARGRFADDPQATAVPWVDSPFFPKLLTSAGLDPELTDIVRRFARDGYVIIDPQIADSLLEETTRQIADAFQVTRIPYWADDRRIQDGWQAFPAVREIATAPRVLEVLRHLYRREPIPFQTLNFRLGSEQRTHSDTIHFNSVPNLFMCGVWVALEDIDERNGPLHYYPQSHKLPVYTLTDLGVAAADSVETLYRHYPLYEDFAEELMKASELERTLLRVKRGEALIWAANLFHGGTPIVDKDRTRLSQVTHYFFSDCFYYTPMMSDFAMGKAALRKVLNLTTGEEMVQSYQGQQIVDVQQWPRFGVCDMAPSDEAVARVLEAAAAPTPVLAPVEVPTEPRRMRARARELVRRVLGRS